MDRELRLCVSEGTGLVEDEDGGAFEDCPRYSHALPLTSRQADTTCADDGVDSLREPREEFVALGRRSRCGYLILGRAGQSHGDVIPDGSCK